MEIILVLKMFLTGVLEFQGFSRKAMLLMASSPGASGASALEIAKKHFHFMVEISATSFHLVLMTTLT
jgi:hypothetical protein